MVVEELMMNFLEIIVNLTSLVIWNLNITVSTTLKYFHEKALNKKLKLMGGAPWHIFLKNYWTMKYLHLWSPGLRIFFLKFVKPSAPHLSYILTVHSLGAKFTWKHLRLVTLIKRDSSACTLLWILRNF